MAAPPDGRVAVVIPAFEAAATIAGVIAEVRRSTPGARIIAVDDGSDDATAGAARSATVVRLAAHHGKGAALAAGIARALADDADWIVTIDADAQHPAGEIPRLLAPVRAGTADLVLGARRRSGPMPLSRRATNWLSSVLASRVAGHPIPDAQTGFRAFRRDVAERVRPAETRYDYELAFLLGTLMTGFRVTAVAVPTVYGPERSHFRVVGDTWRLARVFARHGGRILRGAA
jgi:glycosyltransferase involved in cell wall biosynthesis